MSSTFELLEKLYAVLGDLQPMLEKEDETGNYLHTHLTISIEPAVLEQLIGDLQKYTKE